MPNPSILIRILKLNTKDEDILKKLFELFIKPFIKAVYRKGKADSIESAMELFFDTDNRAIKQYKILKDTAMICKIKKDKKLWKNIAGWQDAIRLIKNQFIWISIDKRDPSMAIVETEDGVISYISAVEFLRIGDNLKLIS